MRTEDMTAAVQKFGADPEALYFLEQDRPELLPYATLQTARRNGDAACRMVDAVYEWQGAPLAFLVDADSVDAAELHRVRRLLAMRGDAPYLGVVAPGSLRLFRVALDSKSPQAAEVALPNGAANSTTFARLANQRPGQTVAHRKWISGVVLRLLTGAMAKLTGPRISDEGAISLVGRALFTRFLADRNLLPESMSGRSTSAHLFDDPDRAKTTSDWLDATFNGDLLPLAEGTFDQLPENGFRVLGDVLRRAPDGQPFLGWQEKWDNLDFAHIPVGVLSQAYELYMREHAPRKQRREGGFFTPRPIAELMVQASFRALRRQGNAKAAKVLDPAAGAGMFLLTVFRELVAEHWRSDGRRPDTNTLRRILYDQLVGFDINEGALRFAALGLYLLSIELDPEPRPVDKLGFDHLRGKVLHRVSELGDVKGKELGSLGPAVGTKHASQYDLVIGNPPWASSTQLPGWKHVREKVAHIAAERGIEDCPPRLPNEGLDLPFVWRAMEWAKPGGQIAFALHARLLFQQGDGMPAARQAVFEALDVTSVINGAELRQTQVWPQISAPFCVLFATNRTPGVEAGFRFVTPRLEESLNGAGNMRIDAIHAEVVASRQLRENPDILKVLFRGSKADLGIVERIRAQGHPTLEEFWRERIGVERGRMRGSGNGYQKVRATSPVQPDGSRGYDASELHGMPEITRESFSGLHIDTQALSPFMLDRVHRKRSVDIFAGTLLVVHKSPPAEAARVAVAVADGGLVYNETYYGYSTKLHPHAATLARYMALVLGSRFVTWLALMTSGEFGFEREVIEKATLDRTPLPDFDGFDASQREEVQELFESLTSGEAAWQDVDKWVASLYGLGERDLQTISDTLDFNLSFATNKRNAQTAPTEADKARFCQTLEYELAPWCERFGSTLAVAELPAMATLPWHAISVRVAGAGRSPVATPTTNDWAGLVSAADATAASEIILESEPNGLLVGRLAQRRYWSTTQARLLAQRIAWSHIEVLKGHVAA